MVITMDREHSGTVASPYTLRLVTARLLSAEGGQDSDPVPASCWDCRPLNLAQIRRAHLVPVTFLRSAGGGEQS